MSDNRVITYTDWSNIANEEFNKNEQNELNKQYIEQAVCKNNIECNLGLHYFNKSIYTSSYVGATRLVDNNGNVIKDKDGKECVLAVEPRFNVDVWKMFDTVLGDDEYNYYDKHDRNKNNNNNKSTDSERVNGDSLLYRIFLDQKPIKIKTNSQQSGNLLLAISFIRQCKNICMKQLKSRDVYTDENLNGKIKGRILFNQHLKKNVFQGREDRIFCRYKVTTVDCIENRILKAALLKAKKIIDNKEHTVQIPNIKSMWRYCMTALDDVRTVNITSADFSAAKTTGYYSFYKPAFSLAKLIIKDSSINISQSEEKEQYIVPYAIKMESLFEFYCRAVIKQKIKQRNEYNKEIDEYNKNHTDQKDKKDEIKILKYQEKLSLLDQEQPETHLQENCIPDIVLCKKVNNKKSNEQDNTEVSDKSNEQNEYQMCVYDVKYKNINNYFSKREDSFQILSYSLLLNAVSCGFIMPEQDNKKISSKNISDLDLEELFPTKPDTSVFISSYKKKDDDNKDDDIKFEVKHSSSKIQFQTLFLGLKKEKQENQNTENQT